MTTTISRFNYQERIDNFQAKLHDYKKRMGVNTHVDLSVIEFNKAPCAGLGSKTINIPSWFLFKYDDIPQRFRITDMNDPRLTNHAFLTEFANWMNEKIGELGLTSICRLADHGILQHVIRLLRNPEMFEKSKDFIFGHELAHLAHSYEGEFAKFLQVASFGGTLSGILFLFFTVSIAPVVHVGITVAVSGIAFALTIGGIVGVIRNQSAPVSGIEEERKADLDAAKMLNNAEGGIYYFQSSIDRHLAIRRSSPTLHRDIDERGNNIEDKDHPLLTERVAYLTQWQREQRVTFP